MYGSQGTRSKPQARPVSVTLLSLIVVVLTWGKADAATRRVPQDFAAIQTAIVAAQDGDTVLVAPGTYFENINFIGKAIEVRSSGGPLAGWA
jgi:polygalacturonase